MKYTAKDVSKIMNINRETLRYYEKLDLLSPEIDEKNGYRYYDDWDLNYIGECKHFRSLGFNIQEIKEIFQNDNLRDFTEKMEEKQQTYLNQLKFYEMLVKKNASDIEKLKNISTSLSFCQITETNQRYFVPNRKNFDFSCSKSNPLRCGCRRTWESKLYPFCPNHCLHGRKNLQISGDIYGNLLARVNEEDGLHRYIEIYFPISS